MSIEVRNISKTFGVFGALKDVSLTVGSGELVALLGPSGSGKTTLLRIIAGLEQPDDGSGPILFHDKDEALELANRVVVMNAGRIEQADTPDEVFHRPRTEFVMDFLGQVNRFRGRMQDGKLHFAAMAWDIPEHAAGAEKPAHVFVRPHDFEVGLEQNGEPGFLACVKHIHSAGPNVRLDLEAATGETLCAEVTQNRYRELSLHVGSRVFVAPRHVKFFASESA